MYNIYVAKNNDKSSCLFECLLLYFLSLHDIMSSIKIPAKISECYIAMLH